MNDEYRCERCGGAMQFGEGLCGGSRGGAEAGGANAECSARAENRPVGLGPLDRPWTQAEAAYALGVSPSEVRKLTRRGELPMLPQIGRTVRYWPETVLKFRDGWRPKNGRDEAARQRTRQGSVGL